MFSCEILCAQPKETCLIVVVFVLFFFKNSISNLDLEIEFDHDVSTLCVNCIE